MSIYGIKMAARTLGYLTRKSAILQNNLANQSTDGFRFDYVFGTNDAGAAPTLNRAVSGREGSFLETGNPLDLALSGPGFFVVDTPQGQRLTRNGSFHLSPDRQIVDSAGRPVLGDDGPITVEGSSIEISSDGTVTVDDKDVARLRIVTVDAPSALSKEGASLFVPPAPVSGLSRPDAATTVRQYGVEESNVDAISGLGDLIEIQRNFAMMTGTMRTMDEVLATVTNNVGRV